MSQTIHISICALEIVSLPTSPSWLRLINAQLCATLRIVKATRRIKKSATTSISRFKSEKTGRIVEAESPVERDLFRTWEFDPNVIDYVHQPLRIEYVGMDGKEHTYTPDGLARFRCRPKGAGPNGILVEVKTRRYLARNWPKIRPAMRAAIAWAKERGIVFHIYNEKKIRTQYFKNASFLLPYRQVDCRRTEARELLDLLTRGSATLGHLLDEACKAGLLREDSGPALYALIATFQAFVDLEKPLTSATVVCRRKGGRI